MVQKVDPSFARVHRHCYHSALRLLEVVLVVAVKRIEKNQRRGGYDWALEEEMSSIVSLARNHQELRGRLWV